MDADEIIKTLLSAYGLNSPEIVKILDAALQDDPTQFSGQNGQQLALITVRGTAAYKERFKANEYRKANGYAPKSEDEIIGLENAFKTTLRANSLPQGFYDRQEDFNNFIGRDVSPNELNNRISLGYNAVMQAEPGTKAELLQLYGLQPGDIAAFFIDPTRFNESSAIKKAQAAQVASEARRQAGIGLTAGTAEALATEGVTRQQAQQGFTEIGASQELYGLTTAEQASGQQAITQEQQIGGVFGTNAEARKAIAERKRKRTAAFEQGGSVLTTQAGNIGLGTVGQ
jgi:hypothetical protein